MHGWFGKEGKQEGRIENFAFMRACILRIRKLELNVRDEYIEAAGHVVFT